MNLKSIFNMTFSLLESPYTISQNSENSQLSEIRTNFVLLPDSGGRFRREVNVSSVHEDTESDLHTATDKVTEAHQTDDDNKIYSSEEKGSSRGHVSVEEHLENVDISEEVLEAKINNLTKSHENEFKFENVSLPKEICAERIVHICIDLYLFNISKTM